MKTITLLLISSIGYTQTKDSVYNYLVEIGIKHPKIVLAQSQLETGHYKSYSCRVRKNLFGLRYNHKYLEFNSWKESCIAYKNKVQYKYKEGDYFVFLSELGYASDPNYINKLKEML